MSDVTITVRGQHETRLAPERATLHATVRCDGSERSAVVDEALRLAEPVRESLVGGADAGTLDEWSSTRLAVRAERPWNTEGRRLAMVYYASVDFSATFREASDLSIWASEVSAYDGVELGAVDWTLTTATRARVEREVAASAVGVAVARAEAYATALGLSSVTPLEIADVGLISSHPERSRALRSASFAADSAGAAMQYEPDDIVVSAIVEARFIAR